MLPSSSPALLLAFHDACHRSDQAIVAAKLTALEALKPENAPRNRYTNVLPWDSSRVVLRGGSCDYINASHLRSGSFHLIATQGPLPSTCQDFFLMLQEHAVRLVVALGPADEMGRVKFHPYWSHDSVTIKSQRQWDDCAVTERICCAIVGGKQHEFVHLHAYDWPDHGVPQNPTAIVNIVRNIMSHAGGTVALHCSAGIGRTGAVCLAVHAAEVARLARLQDGTCQVTAQILVDGLVLLRQQRSGMVQTDAQFALAGRVAQIIVDIA